MTAAQAPGSREVLGPPEIGRALIRIAHEILERAHGADDLVLLGIPTRGLPLARRLAATHRRGRGRRPRAPGRGARRHDVPRRPAAAPDAHASARRRCRTGGIDDRVVVLVDDVLFSGRTIRAAMDALTDLGRPERRAARRPGRPGPPRAADPRGLRRQEPADLAASEKVARRALVETDGVDSGADRGGQ